MPALQQCFPQPPVQPVRSMPINLPDITLPSSVLPAHTTKSSFESSRAFQNPADAVSFSYGVDGVPPVAENSGFALNWINESDFDLSTNMHRFYPGRGPVFGAAGDGSDTWNVLRSNTGISPSYGFAAYRNVFQSHASATSAIAPFLADLETPTVNPAMVLPSIPYGSNISTGRTSFSIASPSSMLSDGTLFGDSDAFTGSSGTGSSALCIATPRASSRESTQSLPTMGPDGGKPRQNSRVPEGLHAISPECQATERSVSDQLMGSRTPHAKAQPAETSGEVTRLGRKRKHDLVRRTTPMFNLKNWAKETYL
jgi:hypothetical protein